MRRCRPLDGAAPAAVFATVEADTLQPLPAHVFTPAAWSTPRIGPDIHAKVGKILYSLRWQHISDHLDARETATVVQFFHHGTLVTPTAQTGRQADRPVALPAGEDRVPRADPDLVPRPG